MSRKHNYNSDTLWRLNEIGGPDLALRYVELSDNAARDADESEPCRQPTLRSLRFYSGFSSPPEIDQRHLAFSFPRSETRFVYFQIEAENLWEYVSWTYKISAQYFSPDGTVMAEFEDECETKPGRETFIHSRGWGWDKPGNWPVGTYHVAIRLDEKYFASGEFLIWEDEPLKWISGTSERLPKSRLELRQGFLGLPLREPGRRRK